MTEIEDAKKIAKQQTTRALTLFGVTFLLMDVIISALNYGIVWEIEILLDEMGILITFSAGLWLAALGIASELSSRKDNIEAMRVTLQSIVLLMIMLLVAMLAFVFGWLYGEILDVFVSAVGLSITVYLVSDLIVEKFLLQMPETKAANSVNSISKSYIWHQYILAFVAASALTFGAMIGYSDSWGAIPYWTLWGLYFCFTAIVISYIIIPSIRVYSKSNRSLLVLQLVLPILVYGVTLVSTWIFYGVLSFFVAVIIHVVIAFWIFKKYPQGE